MKNRYLKSYVLSLLSALALAACGGGGGGGAGPTGTASQELTYTPPANENAFSLTPLKSLSTYANLSFPAMTGSDETSQYTASLTITYDPTVLTIPGIGNDVTSIQSNVTLTKKGTPDETSTSVGTSYYKPGYILAATTLGKPATMTCLPVPGTFNAPPDEATDGQLGSLVDLICNNTPQTTISITWRLEKVDADKAKFIITEKSYVDDKPDATEEDSYIINRGGYVKRLEVKVTNHITGSVRNLAGDRQ